MLRAAKNSSCLAVGLSGLLLGLMTLSGGGCRTEAQRMARIRTAFYGQDLTLANQLIADGLKRSHGNADVLKLDRAMVELAAGRAADAEQTLREVRDHLDYLEQQDLGEITVSYLTDDQHRAYAGEDYEKILLRGLLALSNLFHDGTDAAAYSLQMMDKQEQIIAAGGDSSGENPKRNYPRVALAPYVYGMLREASHREYDDAQRSYEVVVSWQPQFTPGREDWQRAVYGRHSSPGNGVLYVFALTGRGPYKEEVVETPSSAALLIAGELASQLGQRSVTPNIAPVKVPRVVLPDNRVRALDVSVDSRPLGVTSTVTDVGCAGSQSVRGGIPQDGRPRGRAPLPEERGGVWSPGGSGHSPRLALQLGLQRRGGCLGGERVGRYAMLGIAA